MKHHWLSLEDVARMANGLGAESIKYLSALLPEVNAKYGNVVLGQVEAAINKMGGLDNWNAWLAGDLNMEIKAATPKLFDRSGRRIPPRNLKSAVCDSNTNFNLTQPEINYTEIINRLNLHFLGPMGTERFLSASEFKRRSEALLAQLRQDEFLANLLRGVWLPVCLPHLSFGNYGQCLEEIFLPAIESVYEKHFPDRVFDNQMMGQLAASVSYVEESRHGELLKRMEQGPVAGIMFFPLQGFSILAQREQISSLPASLLLCGAIDMATAIVAHPGVLARDFNTPGYDCAAVSWQSAGRSLYFKANNDDLGLNNDGYLGFTADNYSGALLFLG
jgi:hypothetical protein